MNKDVMKHDYLRCVECSRSNAVAVIDLHIFNQKIAFRRFNSSHEHVWMQDDDDEWHCPKHAHLATNMTRGEFERYRDNSIASKMEDDE